MEEVIRVPKSLQSNSGNTSIEELRNNSDQAFINVIFML